ncbi:Formamidopyrimidine-DNA glycosylase N-terminal domain-containing protein, partial [Morchella snyderi]
MPEIAEVSRIVNRLRTHLVGKTITKITPFEDAIVYKDTTHEAFKKALEGKKVLEARQWGKYFWLVMGSSPHPLMHFGMTGWIRFQHDSTAHYRATTPEENPEWPPRFAKFLLHLPDASELAFTDPRRLARIRLIDHPTGDLRSVSPLLENGPDPVQSPVSVAWLSERLAARRVPLKAWLLDQSVLAGIGNWVGDEILYHARIHPEQVTNTLDAEMVARLHGALGYVTGLAVSVEADSSKFPKDWLMLHRWGKGSKKENKLPSGEKIDFIKVGSRTSAYVPSLQKIVGEPVKKRARKARQADGEDGEQDGEEGEGSEAEVRPAPKRRAKAKAVKKEEADGDAPLPARRSLRSAAKTAKEEP